MKAEKEDEMTVENRADPCATCDGTGKILEGNRDCPDCDGPAKRTRYRNRSLAERRSALHTGYERRTFTFEPGHPTGSVGLQLRSGTTTATVPEDGIIPLVGYAIRYGTPYDVQDRHGVFSETMEQRACSDTLADGDDVVFMYDHDSLVMGRRSAGTLTLDEDAKGLPIAVDLDARQQVARDLGYAIGRGDVRAMSIGFSVRPGGEKWNAAGTVRKISAITLHDVSAVGSPCSGSTSIGLAGTADTRSAATALLGALEGHLEERAQSYGNLQSALQPAIEELDGCEWAYILDFDDLSVWYTSGGDTWQVGYGTDDDGNVTISGDPVEVRPVTTYAPLSPEPSDDTRAADDDELRGRQRQLLTIQRQRLALV